jgi:hypothetical protein
MDEERMVSPLRRASLLLPLAAKVRLLRDCCNEGRAGERAWISQSALPSLPHAEQRFISSVKRKSRKFETFETRNSKPLSRDLPSFHLSAFETVNVPLPPLVKIPKACSLYMFYLYHGTTNY